MSPWRVASVGPRLAMNKPRDGKFYIPEMPVLIFATALAMALTRHSWPGYIESFGPGGDAYHQTFATFMYQVRYLIYTASYFTASWSLACLILGLRQSSTNSRALFSQPGMVACLTTAVVVAFRIATNSISLLVSHLTFGDMAIFDLITINLSDTLTQVPSEIGCAVAAAWVVQWAGGRWQSESSWTGRMGRALGILWILTIPFSPFSWST